MPRLAANLSMMFNEVPFLDRFSAARKAGFDGVEFLFPYEHPKAELRKRLDGEGLNQALFNMPPGDWAKGDRGLASLPGRQAEFRDGVKQALDYAEALGCKLVHCMAGIVPAGVSQVTAASLYAANLAWASGRIGAIWSSLGMASRPVRLCNVLVGLVRQTTLVMPPST